MKVRGYRVYYIDPEKGVNDLIELIKNTPSKQIALVIHNRLLLLNSPINLKLIDQYARKYRRDIVFINPDPLIIKRVSSAGFAIFPDLDGLAGNMPYQAEAAGKEGDKSDQTEQSKHRRKKGFMTSYVGFMLMLLILGMAYFYFLYPTAEVEITPVIREESQQLELVGSTSISSIDWDSNTLPLHQISIDLIDQQELKTSGARLIGEIKARGIVKFINERQEEVKIPAGTIVMTNAGNKFRTSEDLLIPSLQIDYLMDVPVGMKAGQGEVAIEALTKGTVGNINTGRIKQLEKKLEQIHVINPEPTRGGRDKRLSVVTADDITRLKKTINNQLRSGLITKLYQRLGGNYRIIEQGIEFSEPEITFSHQVGETAEVLKATASLTASGYVIRNNELDRLSTKKIREALPVDLQLASSGINISTILLEEMTANLYNIKMEVLTPLIPKIDTGSIIKQIQGMEITSARKMLEEREDIESYRIISKTNNIPGFSFAIKVKVAEPESYQVFKMNN